MNNNAKILFLVCITLLFSCKGVKPLTEQEIITYQQEGFTLGYIEATNNETCKWVLSTENSNAKYDPINIHEFGLTLDYSKKNKILFKFLPLRMKNRCTNLLPIRLLKVIENKKGS